MSMDPSDHAPTPFAICGTHWFDERRHPTFTIGSCTFPAFVLPLGVIVLWLLRARRGRPRKPEISHEAMSEKLPAPRGITDDEIPQRHQRYLNGLCHLVEIMRVQYLASAFVNRKQEQVTDLLGPHFAYLEVIILVGSALFRTTGLERRVAFTASALSWLFYSFAGRLPALTTIAIILALPCALHLPEQDRSTTAPISRVPSATALHAGVNEYSAVAVLVLTLDAQPFPEAIRASMEGKYWYWRWVVHPVCLAIICITSILSGKQDSTTTWRKHLTGSLRIFIRLAASLLVLALGAYTTSFLSSCLGWRPFLGCLPAEPPSWETWRNGIVPMVYLFTWMFRIWWVGPTGYMTPAWQGFRGTFVEVLEFNLDVGGATCIILVGVWVFSLVYRF